jgi:hypothetical protein
MRTLLVLFLLASTLAHAAPKNWGNLSRLQSGETIAVTTTDGRESRGDFIRSSADALVFRSGGAETAIECPRITRVTLLSQSKRRRNVLIGIAIGLGVSLLLDRTVGVYLNNETGYSSGERAAVWTAPAAGFGAIGAAVPSHPVIYKAPAPH